MNPDFIYKDTKKHKKVGKIFIFYKSFSSVPKTPPKKTFGGVSYFSIYVRTKLGIISTTGCYMTHDNYSSAVNFHPSALQFSGASAYT